VTRQAQNAEILRGLAAVARAIGVASIDTVVAYARLSTDPLPLMVVRGQDQIHRRILAEWVARREGGVLRDGRHLERLNGEVEIAADLGVNIRTVRRLAARATDPLPVYGSRRGRWTYAAAVRDWQSRQVMPFAVADKLRAA
jgi:hypothetical protein